MIWNHGHDFLSIGALTAFSLFTVWRSTKPSLYFKRPYTTYPLFSASALMLFHIILTVPHLKDLNRKVAIRQMLQDKNETLFSHLGLVREWIEEFYQQEK